ncbi:beta-xylosidase [Sphingomonas sp. AP4-R1]|uniref:GH39 family glycosyl hydrolase n=1 Tax=Sphingomonas sp. AP4-R1 TaxID=2735134 RepID=UPI0014938B62|nr:beta-xylosidase [Sphingomonas sp. AP4-R1]QJU58551.1 beta-xylosidase [Sphingomonas sp. AP4-R1]
MGSTTAFEAQPEAPRPAGASGNGHNAEDRSPGCGATPNDRDRFCERGIGRAERIGAAAPVSRQHALSRPVRGAARVAIAAAIASLSIPGTAAAQAIPQRIVTTTVHARTPDGVLPPVWRFFGADEPNYATMKDGEKLLAELGKLRKDDVFFRAHNLLNTGDGTAAFKWGSTNVYTETKDGKPVYNWTNVDRIIDTYRAQGIRPYLQIGFMPEALSSAPPGTPYRHSWRPGFDYKYIIAGWAYPPKDYDKWRELVYQWTLHNIERYGRAEVERWYFEIWNEANGWYWKASFDEFYKMHDYAVDGIRRALPNARVGGPDSGGSGGAFMDGFLRHVTSGKNYATGQIGTPTDFLAFHAKGQPTFVDGHVRMGLSTHLKEVNKGFDKTLSVAPLATKPVIIGESDPEGCAACPGPENAYRNGTMYSSYTAASFARIWELAARRHVNLEGVLSWSFEFEDQPWFAGYRQLATNGVDLPVLNVLRLFAKLGTQKLAATSDGQLPLDRVMADGVRGPADVGTIATRTADGKIAVLLWHYHDDDVAGPSAAVRLSIDGIARVAAPTATIWRVDSDHADAFTAWKKIGSPLNPDSDQYAALEKASAMRPEPLKLSPLKRGTVDMSIDVPRQGVALVILDAR